MAYRFPPLSESQMTREQKEAKDFMDDFLGKYFGKNGDPFLYKNDQGEYVGPFAVLLRTPPMVKPFLEIATGVGQIKGLSARCRELAILATGSVYKSAYELYAHSRVAEKIGLSHAQVLDARSGKTPADLSEEEVVTYEVGLKLVKTPGNLDKESYERAHEVLGEQATLALIHYVGIYAYTCVVLNGAAVPAEGSY